MYPTSVTEAARSAELRIRDAALEAFSEHGIQATSFRAVSEAAGVSLSLVQDFFPTQAALREAVDEYVVSATSDALVDLLARWPGTVGLEEIGERVTTLIGEHPLAFRYVGRVLADGDPTALQLLDSLIGIADTHLRRLAAGGRVRSDLDLEWAAVQVVLLNVATVLFEPAVTRHFDEPFSSPESLERWRRASTALFVHGWDGVDTASPRTRIAT